MTVTATYICGHTHKISGPMEQEASEQAKEQYCVGCTEFHRSKGFYPIVENELVALEGSEKQVAWAIRLRMERIEQIHNYIARGAHLNGYTPEEIARVRAAFLQSINEQTQAKWWIDIRDRAGLKPFAAAYEKAYAEHV
jgi:hypothetical protein